MEASVWMILNNLEYIFVFPKYGYWIYRNLEKPWFLDNGKTEDGAGVEKVIWVKNGLSRIMLGTGLGSH